MKQLVIIAHNLRSAHNVGSLLRTAEGLGVHKVYVTGYTPYPSLPVNDPRLPHERAKIDKLIQKTALNAQISQAWEHYDDIAPVLERLRSTGYQLAALEQTNNSVALPSFKAPNKLAIILGREVEGVEPEIIQACDYTLEIPMFGKKESFNVVQAAAMALYHCQFLSNS